MKLHYYPETDSLYIEVSANVDSPAWRPGKCRPMA